MKRIPMILNLIDALPEFYRDICTSFNECRKTLSIENLSNIDILLQPIWCNNLFKFKGKTLYLSHWIKSGFIMWKIYSMITQ